MKVVRIAALTLSNALIFQEVLSSIHIAGKRPVRTIRSCLADASPIDAFLEEWRYILDEVDYIPIFSIARNMLASMSSGPRLELAMRRLANAALLITAKRAALRHDLMGRVYHRLLADAKYYGAFYTTIPAATLLLKLAVQEWDFDWSDLHQVEKLRIADLACGTGTLLKAALQAIEDNHIRARANAGVKPSLPELHRALIEKVLMGFDVLPFAVHLSAAALAFHEPGVPFLNMELRQVPLGGPARALGSMEMDDTGALPAQNLLEGGARGPRAVTGAGVKLSPVVVPPLDLCVMNPPFTRSTGGNLLFGSLPKAERKKLQSRLQERVKKLRLQANVTAGLGSVFVALADKRVKEGGRMALVLPKGLVSGSAWQPTRDLLTKGRPPGLTPNGGNGYELQYVIISHEPWGWHFSENTKLSECLLVARKLGQSEMPGDCVFVNLWEKPQTSLDALALARLLETVVPVSLTADGVCEIITDGRKFGEALRTSNVELRTRPWTFETAFAQTELCRTAYHLSQGGVYIPGRNKLERFPVTTLQKMGASLGPDSRDIMDGFQTSVSPSTYLALWDHDSDAIKTIAQRSNKFLSPLPEARKDRHLRSASLLWSRAGKLMLAERLWFNTQRLTAVLLEAPALSNVWWPTQLHNPLKDRIDDQEKALALWLNSTLGLIALFAARLETKGAWVKYKKPALNPLPVPNLAALSASQLSSLAKGYQTLSTRELKPFPEIAADDTREEIDKVITSSLGIQEISVLREMLAREPVVSLSRIARMKEKS